MNFLITLKAEFYKMRHTAIFYITLGAAAFGPLMSLLEILTEGVASQDANDLLQKSMIIRFEMTGFVLLPVFVMLMCTLIPQTEFRNNTWKQVLASPQSRAHIFFAKFTIIQILVAVFLIGNQFFMFASVLIVNFSHPEMHVLQGPFNFAELLSLVVKCYAGLLALAAVQFSLGLRFKNFIASLGIGLALWFAGSLFALQADEAAVFFPYSLHAFSGLMKLRPYGTEAALSSVCWSALFLAGGLMLFRRRRYV